MASLSQSGSDTTDGETEPEDVLALRTRWATLGPQERFDEWLALVRMQVVADREIAERRALLLRLKEAQRSQIASRRQVHRERKALEQFESQPAK